MADSKTAAAPLTRAELREELDRFRGEMYRELGHYATKSDVANLRTWMVGLLLVVVLNVVGTAGAIVAAVLTRLSATPDAHSRVRGLPIPRSGEAYHPSVPRYRPQLLIRHNYTRVLSTLVASEDVRPVNCDCRRIEEMSSFVYVHLHLSDQQDKR